MLAPTSRHLSAVLRGTHAGLRDECSFHATITSHARSPTPIAPQSITPLMRPSRTSQLRTSRSPWCQTVGPFQGGATSARSHSAVRGGVAVEPRQPIADVHVSLGQRDAATRRRARRIHLLQRGDERRQVARGLDRLDFLDRPRLALNPGASENQGYSTFGASLRHRDWDLEGDELREPREPIELLPARLRGSPAADSCPEFASPSTSRWV